MSPKPTKEQAARNVHPTVKPYELHPQDKKILASLAKKSHKPCHGTGLTGWMKGGTEAVLCSCVRNKAARMEPALERLHKQVEGALAEARKPKLRIAAERFWRFVSAAKWRARRAAMKRIQRAKCPGRLTWNHAEKKTIDQPTLFDARCGECGTKYGEVPEALKKRHPICGPLYRVSPDFAEALAVINKQGYEVKL